MATLNQTNPTLLDMVKRKDPNGAHARIVEQLTRQNTILTDMAFREGNLDTGHQFTSRNALPSVAWRRFNQGITPSKSGVSPVTETCGKLGGMSRVDEDLAKLSPGGSGAYRAGEDMAFMQAMRNTMESAAFYSSSKTTPEQFHGLAPRLDATSGNAAASQIIKCDAAASGADQTSVWLIGWGEHSVYGIYPRGATGGIEHIDLGRQLVDDGSGTGASYRALVTEWNWSMGICVEDYRYLVRVCNIDTGSLAGTGTNLIDAMSFAVDQLQDTDSVRPAFYVNRKVHTYLRLQVANAVKNSTLTIENVGGKPVMHFLGIPIRRTDALLNTESVIT